MVFPISALVPDSTGEVENHQAVEDTVDTQQSENNQMEVEKPWQVLTKHAGYSNTTNILILCGCDSLSYLGCVYELCSGSDSHCRNPVKTVITKGPPTENT